MTSRQIVACVFFLSLTFAPAYGSERRGYIKSASTPKLPVTNGLLAYQAGCPTSPIACNSSRTNSVGECANEDGDFVDLYSISGDPGQQVTINLTSPASGADIIDPYLELYRPDGSLVALNDDLGDEDLNARIVHTLDVAGSWIILVSSAEPRDTGVYTLSVACTGAQATCTAGPTNLCLNLNRFKVEAGWTIPSGQSGNGAAVAITGDTGYFTFFNAANVEMVVKILDACAPFSRYWVFAGGLTNVDVVLNITDTRTGTIRTYRNPQNTAFQPIQDTNAQADPASQRGLLAGLVP